VTHRPPRDLEPPGFTYSGRVTFAMRPATPDRPCDAPLDRFRLGACPFSPRPPVCGGPRPWLPSRSPSPLTKPASRRAAPCRPRSTPGS